MTEREQSSELSPAVWGNFRQHYALAIPTNLRPWLTDKGSMTARIRHYCQGAFSLKLLKQAWGKPDNNEAVFLKITPATPVLIREVLLCCYDQPFLFGRTLFPYQLFQGKGRILLGLLDDRPIGDFLFHTPGVKRGDIEIALLVKGQLEYSYVNGYVSVTDHPLWARRSCFTIDKQCLLVTEVFLQDI
jgi:chorismate lyase